MSWGDVTRGKGKEKGKEITHVQDICDRFMIWYISSPPIQGVDSNHVVPPMGHVFVSAWHPRPRTVPSQPLSLGLLRQFRRGIKPLSLSIVVIIIVVVVVIAPFLQLQVPTDY